MNRILCSLLAICLGTLTTAEVSATEKLATPTLQQQFHQHLASLQKSTDNPDLWFALGRVAAWQKDFLFAQGIFDYLLFRDAGQVDYLYARAQLHYWQQQHTAAFALLETARQHAPAYEELLKLQVNVLYQLRDDLFIQRTALKLREHARTRQLQSVIEEIDRLSRQYQQRQQKHWQFNTDISTHYARLTTPHLPWYEVHLGTSARTAQVSNHWSYQYIERFGITNQQLGTSLYFPLAGTQTQVSLAHRLQGEVLPQWKVAVGSTMVTSSAWRPGLQANLTQYTSAQSSAARLSLGKDISLLSIDSYLTQGWMQQAGFFYNLRVQLSKNMAKWHWRSNLSFGKEVEVLPGDRIITARTVELSIGLNTPLNKNILLFMDVGYARQGSYYDRYYSSAGIRF